MIKPVSEKIRTMFDSNMFLMSSISLGIGFVTVPTVLFSFYLYRYPQRIVNLGVRYHMYKSGMKKKYVQCGSEIFYYGEKNLPKPDQPTIVFIHGFTSSKLQWLTVFKNLKTDSHLIAMDMPGHGDSSTPHIDQTIDLDFMDTRVRMFLELVGLKEKKIHLVGISLGGALVGIFSALHPNKVAKVTMICPAMNVPVENEFIKGIKKAATKDISDITFEDCVFFPHDVEGMKIMFNMCLYRKELLNFHNKLYEGMLNLRTPNYPYYLRLFKATNTEEYLNMLSCVAPAITMPSQIIWGKHDEIINQSGAEYLRAKLPKCRYLDKFDNCGHSVDMDQPESLCSSIEKLIQEK